MQTYVCVSDLLSVLHSSTLISSKSFIYLGSVNMSVIWQIYQDVGNHDICALLKDQYLKNMSHVVSGLLPIRRISLMRSNQKQHTESFFLIQCTRRMCVWIVNHKQWLALLMNLNAGEQRSWDRTGTIHYCAMPCLVRY